MEAARFFDYFRKKLNENIDDFRVTGVDYIPLEWLLFLNIIKYRTVVTSEWKLNAACDEDVAVLKDLQELPLYQTRSPNGVNAPVNLFVNPEMDSFYVILLHFYACVLELHKVQVNTVDHYRRFANESTVPFILEYVKFRLQTHFSAPNIEYGVTKSLMTTSTGILLMTDQLGSENLSFLNLRFDTDTIPIVQLTMNCQRALETIFQTEIPDAEYQLFQFMKWFRNASLPFPRAENIQLMKVIQDKQSDIHELLLSKNDIYVITKRLAVFFPDLFSVNIDDEYPLQSRFETKRDAVEQLFVENIQKINSIPIHTCLELSEYYTVNSGQRYSDARAALSNAVENSWFIYRSGLSSYSNITRPTATPATNQDLFFGSSGICLERYNSHDTYRDTKELDILVSRSRRASHEMRLVDKMIQQWKRNKLPADVFIGNLDEKITIQRPEKYNLLLFVFGDPSNHQQVCVIVFNRRPRRNEYVWFGSRSIQPPQLMININAAKKYARVDTTQEVKFRPTQWIDNQLHVLIFLWFMEMIIKGCSSVVASNPVELGNILGIDAKGYIRNIYIHQLVEAEKISYDIHSEFSE